MTRNWRLVDALKDLATEMGLRPAQLAIAWALAKSRTIVPVIGARTPAAAFRNSGSKSSDKSTAGSGRLPPRWSDIVARGRPPRIRRLTPSQQSLAADSPFWTCSSAIIGDSSPADNLHVRAGIGQTRSAGMNNETRRTHGGGGPCRLHRPGFRRIPVSYRERSAASWTPSSGSGGRAPPTGSAKLLQPTRAAIRSIVGYRSQSLQKASIANPKLRVLVRSIDG